MNGYELSRSWWNFAFENPEKVKPLHAALYFFAIEHCNRLGWKYKFGLPTEMAKDAIGVKSWHTYISAFNDLVEWGFFLLIEKSKNQYSSNIIALSKFDEALDEAYDKAITKHVSKHQRSTHQSIDSINKPITIKPKNNKSVTNYKKSLLSEIEISDAFSSEHFEIAKSFQKLFKANLEEAGASTAIADKAKGTWIDDIRLMIEKDGYSLTDLRNVYVFLQKDAFWKQNILSTSKLREQMPKIKLKIHNGKNRTNHKEGTSWDELAEILKVSFDKDQ